MMSKPIVEIGCGAPAVQIGDPFSADEVNGDGGSVVYVCRCLIIWATMYAEPPLAVLALP